MWSQIILCVLVGFAYASNNPGWKDNTEYVYEVRGRTISSLHDVANEYSGVLLKAKLIVHPKSDGSLKAKLSDVQYGELHAELAEGWETYIPDSQMTYHSLEMTSKPFEIVMKNGVVCNLIVDQQVPEWEANIIKSIVSQLQLDTKAENLIQSRVNSLPKHDENTAVFKTLEDTVTGITETLYDIHALPDYVLQTKPWLAPFPHLKGDGQIIEIVKSKNFSRSENRPSYYFGLSGIKQWEPATNQMGNFWTRTSIGHAIITGNLNRFTVQHSMTVNKIIVTPTLDTNQHGSVYSMLNITLSHAQEQTSDLGEVSQPIHLGNLVYRYQQNEDNKVRAGPQFNRKQYYQDSVSASSSESSEEENLTLKQNRHPRSIPQRLRALNREQYMEDRSISSEEDLHQHQPKLNEVPQFPLLPYTIGYHGKSVRHAEGVHLEQVVQQLAEQIGQDMQNVEEIPKKNTLARFTLLTTLSRLLTEEELKHIASNLYTTEQQDSKYYSWVAFRDAVSEAGTGPAFLTIKEWIETKKIKHQEAADVLQTMASAARQPTEEYVRAFFSLTIKPEVTNQWQLNKTALLAFTDLVRKAFVDKHFSHLEYPVHSFGQLYTKSAELFVEKEVIPYLSKQLHEAINNADVRQIHLYIRALGNVAHRQILHVFEPYWEGHKQVSQFQRLLMVMATNKLVSVQPELARSVLYRIYQNAGEVQEVRIAAVYQLMRTNPPVDMLQRMAEYTNVDTNEQVNAAVKSAIQTAAKLEGTDFAQIRLAAEGAQPLLTKKEYGLQYAQNYLRSFVQREISASYKQDVQSIVSEDNGLPNVFKYVLNTDNKGYYQDLIQAQAMVSSIDDLVNVWEKQTLKYKHDQENQQQAQQSEQTQWSSENIARLLNLKIEEREQLEGNLYLRLGDYQQFFSFDNHSIEQIPEMLREFEQAVKAGKSFKYTKFINQGEWSIALPTETGLPFVLTYDRPIVFSVEGKIEGQAKPQLLEGNKLVKPESVQFVKKIKAVVSAKTQIRFGFVTPFNHKHYTAGLERNVQIYAPLSSKVNVNLKTHEAEIEIEALEPEKNSRLFHYSSWPYTSIHDILKFTPVTESESTQIIYQKTQHKMDQVFGQKSIGMAFRVKYTTEQRFFDFAYFAEIFQKQDVVSTFITSWLNREISHTEVDVDYEGQLSTARKLKLRWGHQAQHQSEYQDESNTSESEYYAKELSALASLEANARKQAFLKKASVGIHEAQTQVYDFTMEFEGQQKTKFAAVFAFAKNDADSKSRVLWHLKKTSDVSESKPFELNLVAKNSIPNTNGLDLTYAMEFKPITTSQVQVVYGENMHTAKKVDFHVQLRKSEERVQYLRELPQYHQCKSEMAQGNFHLSACSNMTENANLLDHVKINVKYEDVDSKIKNAAYKIYSAFKYMGYFNLDEDLLESDRHNQLDFEARFNPDFHSVDVVLVTEKWQAKFESLRVNKWVRQVVAVHPVFHMTTRLESELLGLRYFRPECVVDKTVALSFDNKTYPLSLSSAWTVMLQYAQRYAQQQESQQPQQRISGEQQIKRQLENYVVLVREIQEGQKEVKIVVAVPQTEGHVVEINIQPASGQVLGKVTINGKPIETSQHKTTEQHHGFIRVYALPNGEIKIELANAFYVIYDGARVKLTAQAYRLRGAIRGLCGTFTGEKSTDFLTANDCVIWDPLEFIASYTVLKPEEQQHQQYQEILNLKARSQQSHCIYKKLPLYANVISEQDTQEWKWQTSPKMESCSFHRTRYIRQNNEICFSLRPLPICRSSCQQRGTVTKNVEVHCVKTSKVAELWVEQIDQGANPDFGVKPVSRSIRMELPQSCSK